MKITMEKVFNYIEYKSEKSGTELAADLGFKHSQQYYQLKNKRSRDFEKLVRLQQKYDLPWDELGRVLADEYSSK